MRILLYEFVTGGGWHSAGSSLPPASFVAEGAAMLRSLASDFAAIDGLQIDTLRDRRFRDVCRPVGTIHEINSAAEEQTALADLSRAADWSVIIAPEFDGHLTERCRTVQRAGGTLLGPNASIVALASDKHATAKHLAARGVNVPNGVALSASDALPDDFAYPAVLKPRDGAGSQGVRLIEDPRSYQLPKQDHQCQWRLEEFRAGTPASVACLCGPRQILPLAPCLQRLSDDVHFQYLGGSLPLDPPLAERAAQLAKRAIGTLDGPLGYLGVDLVLGLDPSGAADVVIEINPRLTTSYVGLRAIARGNLAAAMLAIAQGRRVELSWQDHSMEFDAGGRLRFELVSGGV